MPTFEKLILVNAALRGKKPDPDRIIEAKHLDAVNDEREPPEPANRSAGE